ncbi:UBAP1-MVB12-associated (UMA)-domain containing protein 1 [Cololabis saira]|uniref:UBAP1-MVB12-associated (UMA)-domain containing protein 1 n=1 Tax=Cololabis saira TaxID=129043 RepID=UPI002AD4FA3A|nr:UBAP1-MVB12-associated (UMA)-domain containing protein 1 [Cololabis saira]
MLSFFGFRKDSKKSTSDKEVDGGFVIIGETAEEQRQKMSTMNIAQPSTNVIIRPFRESRPNPSRHTGEKLPAPVRPVRPADEPPAVEAPSASSASSASQDLLSDIPFTLAPHVLAMHSGFPRVTDVLLSCNLNYSLGSYKYDFSLENSVLHNNQSV